MSDLLLMVGIPGSGKSTYIDEHCKEHDLICRDDIRLALGTVFDTRLESHVTSISQTQLAALMKRGRDIVMDETNLDINRIKSIVGVARKEGYTVVAHLIDTPLDICIQRRCSEGFPEAVIHSMNEKLTILRENDFESLRDECDKVTIWD